VYPDRSTPTVCHRPGVVVIGVVVLALAGVAVFVLGHPSVSGIDNRFGGVNETTTVVESDLTVQNPPPSAPVPADSPSTTQST
jgi:LEA14-like dessication related protein